MNDFARIIALENRVSDLETRMANVVQELGLHVAALDRLGESIQDDSGDWDVWDVHLYHGNRESSVNTRWLKGTSLIQVINDSASMRGVDLAQCFNVSAVKVQP